MWIIYSQILLFFTWPLLFAAVFWNLYHVYQRKLFKRLAKSFFYFGIVWILALAVIILFHKK